MADDERATNAETNFGTDLSQEQAEARARIISSAFSAFKEKGYARTSTLEIATRAKVSKRDLYALVGNKQAIFRAGVSQGARRMSPAGSLPPPSDATELKQALANYGAHLLVELSGPVIVAVHRLAIAEADTSPELSTALQAVGLANKEAVAGFLAEAQSRGLIGQGDTAAMADTYMTLVTGRCVLDRLLDVGETAIVALAEARRRAEAAADALLRLYPA